MKAAANSGLLGYGIAMLAVAGAVGLTLLLSGLGDSGISPQFFAAVLISAWYGGRGPGLLATLLSGVAAASLLIVPEASASAVRDDIFRASVFTAVALITSSLHVATVRARQAAEAAAAAKSTFLAMVSHELLTPLSPIMVAVELLQDDTQLPPRVLEDLATIRRNLDIETRLINDLLDLSKVSAGKLQIDLDVVDLHQVIADAAAICEADIQDKGQKLELKLTASDSMVQGDATRLQQIVWNLLRNSNKFTPRCGEIEIRTSNRDSEIVVTIDDSGPGIAMEELTDVFEPFKQASSGLSDRSGLGLGLAICQALTAAHSGKLVASNEGQNRGACFSLYLPTYPIEE